MPNNNNTPQEVPSPQYIINKVVIDNVKGNTMTAKLFNEYTNTMDSLTPSHPDYMEKVRSLDTHICDIIGSIYINDLQRDADTDANTIETMKNIQKAVSQILNVDEIEDRHIIEYDYIREVSVYRYSKKAKLVKEITADIE